MNDKYLKSMAESLARIAQTLEAMYNSGLPIVNHRDSLDLRDDPFIVVVDNADS